MCLACLPRRSLLAAAAVLAAPTSQAASRDGTVEPHMRLAGRPAQGLPVLLTLDACMGGFDARIAEVLAVHDIPATIFATARWLAENPAGLAFLLARRDLFAIENHGAAHLPPILGERRVFGLRVAGDLAAVRHEVEAGAAAIRAATGIAPAWYRGATARYSPAALADIRALGIGVAGFSLNGDEGASLSATAAARRLASALPGDVILAHVNHPERPAGGGVAAGILALRSRGARFLRLDRIPPTDLAYA